MPIQGTVKRLLAALACACLALVAGGADARAVTFGVTEDMVKAKPAQLHGQLVDLGMSENAISVLWNPDIPTALPPDAAAIDEVLRVAAAHKIRIAFAIYQHRPVGLSSASSPILMAQFATWLQTMARRFPTVKEFIAPNEPNQPRFWRPQFDNACQNIAGAAYARVMATMYDAVKSVNPQIEVAGAALSPRGNDNCLAPNNISTSPARFLKYLGDEYRRMKRNRPLMDSFSFHPYPRINTDDPMTGYTWPNIGVANFDRLKQALHDAFEGTAQPTVEEGLKIRIHEMGHETQAQGLPGYSGKEEVPPIDEATQARYYTQLIRFFACDPAVDSINVFHLVDESDLGGLQSGMVRVDGSRKPSYAAVKEAIAEAATKGCTGKPVRWAPSTAVTGANVEFGLLGRGTSSVRLATEEQASYVAGIFRAPARPNAAGRIAIARSLASTAKTGDAIATTRGMLRAYYKVNVRTPARLVPGSYVYALRLTSWANPSRTSVFVSSPFRVGSVWKIQR
jgi:hypothetical protein